MKETNYLRYNLIEKENKHTIGKIRKEQRYKCGTMSLKTPLCNVVLF